MKTFKEFSKINENINFTNESANALKGVKEYRDGLTPKIIKEEYPWLLKAKFKDAIIGVDKRFVLVWYDGVWESGTWEYGTWKSGTWKKGGWYDGTWESGSWLDGVWYNGTWISGTWEDGWWKDGTWKDGTWKDGIWFDGIWNLGRWKKGKIQNQETGKSEESDEPPTEDFD